MAITWSRMNRLRKPIVERNYRLMRTAYITVGRDFVDRVRKFGIQVVTDSDLKKADASPVVDTYQQITLDTVLYFARIGKKSFPKTKKFSEEDYEESQWVNRITAKVPLLTDQFSSRLYDTAIGEVTRVAQTMVSKGIEMGLSIEDIADLIVDDFMSEFGDSAKWMARRVAQTETIRASNFGTKEGVNGLGIEYVQSWLATADNRCRDTHTQAAIDNDRIPQDQKFIVGGRECEYPGDPALPPEECINCRCSWTAEPKV